LQKVDKKCCRNNNRNIDKMTTKVYNLITFN